MIKKLDYSLFLGPHYSLYSLFWGTLFTIHYKKGQYSLIIIPHPDPYVATIEFQIWPSLFTIKEE